jgi:hypothetical protein
LEFEREITIGDTVGFNENVTEDAGAEMLFKTPQVHTSVTE